MYQKDDNLSKPFCTNWSNSQMMDHIRHLPICRPLLGRIQALSLARVKYLSTDRSIGLSGDEKWHSIELATIIVKKPNKPKPRHIIKQIVPVSQIMEDCWSQLFSSFVNHLHTVSISTCVLLSSEFRPDADTIISFGREEGDISKRWMSFFCHITIPL